MKLTPEEIKAALVNTGIFIENAEPSEDELILFNAIAKAQYDKFLSQAVPGKLEMLIVCESCGRKEDCDSGPTIHGVPKHDRCRQQLKRYELILKEIQLYSAAQVEKAKQEEQERIIKECIANDTNAQIVIRELEYDLEIFNRRGSLDVEACSWAILNKLVSELQVLKGE